MEDRNTQAFCFDGYRGGEFGSLFEELMFKTVLGLAGLDRGPASRTALGKSKITREDLLELLPGRVLVLRDGRATLVDASPPPSA